VARTTSNTIARRAARLAIVAGCAFALVQCGESGKFATQNPGGGVTGVASVSILLPATVDFPVNVGDSVLVQYRATSVKKIATVTIRGVAQRGNPAFGTDTVVDRFQERTVNVGGGPQDTTMGRFLRPIFTDSTAEQVLVIVTAKDSAGNTGSDTTTLRVAPGPKVSLVRPTNGATSSVGKSVTIEVHASAALGVRVAGWRASGVLTRADSTIVSGSTLPDTVIFIDTLTVPAATPAGALNITGFAVDSAGNPSGSTVGSTITISSATSDNVPALVAFSVGKRVEVDDSVTVHATDPSGISRIGFFVRQVGNATVVAADSLSYGGNQTDVTASFALRLDTVTTYPRLVTVEAFAIDSVGNRGLSSFTTTPVPAAGVAGRDTITVVAGRTIALPSGGQIADGIYDRNRNELYLSNLTLNRLEVFQINTNTFLAGGIPVGARPFGLALWPRDTLGNYADTVIVANSGGTNLSIVDVANRVERRRHPLPNYLIQKVKTALDPATQLLVLNITEFDYADRPLFVGTACRNNCATVLAVYSTTPTPAQATASRGYLAWENLTAPAAAPQGHFFWEPATGSASLATDTLQVIAVRDTAPGLARRDTVLGAGVGIIADFNQLVYQDTTFVRNSGDFNHALVGEGGGEVAFARALTFDARAGTAVITGGGGLCALLGYALKCDGVLDLGVSQGIFVRDFLGNRASRVRSVATNFNGRTNFIRADSVYVADFTLRLAGLIQVGGLNPGMDVNPRNNFDARTRGSGGFGGAGSPNDRLMYAARPDANIEVFDTYWYQSVALIPVRDTIIGPIRLALNNAGQQVLVGVTSSGVVVVPIATPITNPLPVRQGLRAAH
jgi:hypothetical protein